MQGIAMMNSINKINAILMASMLMALMVLCLLPYAMIGDCRTAFEGQMNASVTGPALLFPESPVAVDDRSLDGALKIYSPFVLDCWENGCRPCELMDPKIDHMAADFKGKIVFGKLCTDYNPITTSKYGVSRTPSLLVFKNGSLVYKHVGNYPIGDLEHMILTVLHMR
jgi:thiol-disulfide isomerase/thioredoxin